MKKCWFLFLATYAIASANPPNVDTQEENIDSARTVRQTGTFSSSNQAKRRQPIPRPGILIVDTDYVVKNFGIKSSRQETTRDNNGIPSPYLIQPDSQNLPISNLASASNNAQSSFNNNNDNLIGNNFNYNSQSYNNQQHSQLGFQSNLNYIPNKLSTTADNSVDNLISYQPAAETSTSNNKKENFFENYDNFQSGENYNDNPFISSQKVTEKPEANLVYNFDSSKTSQVIGNNLKNLGFNFASNEDIHTDNDDLNALGVSLLSNDGINNKRSVGVALPQTDVVNSGSQDSVVLGKDNNQIIIANENQEYSQSSSNNVESVGQPLQAYNGESNDRSTQQFTIQRDFEPFGNQGGSYSPSQSSLSSVSNDANQQSFTVRGEDSFETFGSNAATFGVPIPKPVLSNPDSIHDNNKVESFSTSQSGQIGIPLPFTISENNQKYEDSIQGGNNDGNQGGSLGIPLPSLITDSNNLQHQDNVESESVRNANRGGSFGIPLPSSIANSAGQAQNNVQVDSVINAINGLNNPTEGQIENLIGGMTIGELLNGINGKNGIVVLPMSSAKNVDGINLQAADENKISIRESSDEVILESTPSTPITTTGAAPVTRARSSRRTTTRPPDHLRRSLSDLLYAKGQWFGTLMGGLIDYGIIVRDAYKNTFDNNEPRKPYAS